VGAALADAIRRKWPPDKIVELVEGFLANADAEIRFKAFQFIGDRGYGKPVEQEVEPELTVEEYKAEVAAIVREEVAAMSPEERMKLLADPAPTHTIQ